MSEKAFSFLNRALPCGVRTPWQLREDLAEFSLALHLHLEMRLLGHSGVEPASRCQSFELGLASRLGESSHPVCNNVSAEEHDIGQSRELVLLRAVHGHPDDGVAVGERNARKVPESELKGSISASCIGGLSTR